jgi:hypothetical protein
MSRKQFSYLFLIFSSLFMVNSINAQTIISNPAAPANLDANLQVGETAIAVDNRWELKKVTVLAKGNGTYNVVPIGTTDWEIKNQRNVVKTYKANSVYKDFDMAAFNNAVRPFQQYVEPFLECYAVAFKFPSAYVTGKEKWGSYYIKDIKEYDLLTGKLGELWQIIQTKFPNVPNTYSPYTTNPVVWASIAKNREPMVKCIGQNPNDENIKWMLKDIANAKRSVDAFNGTNDLYSGGSLDWIWRAVSAGKRQEFYAKQTGFADFEALALKVGKDPNELKNKLNTELDAFKGAVEPKLAEYKMKDWYFKFQDAPSQAKMKAYLKNPATLKIYKTGVSDEVWQIEKNSLGIPLYRYKRGQMLVRNSADDHKFCKGLFFVVKQTYSGGGGYGGSEIGEYHEELYGCP